MTKRIKRRTPGSRNVLHTKKRMTSSLNCPSCGALLKGVKRMGTARLANTNASRKSVNRKFGGSLCAACSRDILKAKARSI